MSVKDSMEFVHRSKDSQSEALLEWKLWRHALLQIFADEKKD